MDHIIPFLGTSGKTATTRPKRMLKNAVKIIMAAILVDCIAI